MKNNLEKLTAGIVVTGLLIMLSVTTVFGECAKPYSVGWESWEPYQFQNEAKELKGLDVELISAIASNANCSVKFVELPWKRHLTELEAGVVDLAGGASKTPEREVFANFSSAYRKETAVMYVRKGESDKFKFKKLFDLSGTQFRLGITREYFYGDEFDKLSKDTAFKSLLQEVQSDALNYPKLMKGRIDGFLADPVAAAAALKKEGLLDKIEVHPMPIYENDIFVMLSKKSVNQESFQSFEKSLTELKKQGKLAQIINKYLHPAK